MSNVSLGSQSQAEQRDGKIYKENYISAFVCGDQHGQKCLQCIFIYLLNIIMIFFVVQVGYLQNKTVYVVFCVCQVGPLHWPMYQCFIYFFFHWQLEMLMRQIQLFFMNQTGRPLVTGPHQSNSTTRKNLSCRTDSANLSTYNITLGVYLAFVRVFINVATQQTLALFMYHFQEKLCKKNYKKKKKKIGPPLTVNLIFFKKCISYQFLAFFNVLSA